MLPAYSDLVSDGHRLEQIQEHNILLYINILPSQADVDVDVVPPADDKTDEHLPIAKVCLNVQCYTHSCFRCIH
jgi:hypothetical protein